MNTTELIEFALTRTCPAGLDYTGDNPEEDHGHTDCWTIHELIKKVRQLEAENAKLAEILMGPYVNVNESHVEEIDEVLATYIGGMQGNPDGSTEDENSSFTEFWWKGLI